jgi:hypothetical protein
MLRSSNGWRHVLDLFHLAPWAGGSLSGCEGIHPSAGSAPGWALTGNAATASAGDGTAIAAGGGIFSEEGTLALNNCTCSGNQVSARASSEAEAGGGGIYRASDVSESPQEPTITGNQVFAGCRLPGRRGWHRSERQAVNLRN